LKNKLMVIGEAWGQEEERERAAFVGSTGYELNRMFEEVGICRADCYLTNVFNRHPYRNQIVEFCGGKDGAIPGYPALVKGKYVRREFLSELNRLGDEIIDVNPNLILALGNTAMWAVCGKTTISKLRGTTSTTTHTVSGYKALPTYHPAAIFRQYELRPTVIMDLFKAAREQEYPEIRRPKREVWIEPTLEDIYDFDKKYIRPAQRLAVDIETSGTAITCIGFAPNSRLAIVIPFTHDKKLGRSYWPSHAHEFNAWKAVRSILERPKPSKVFQNGLYDIAFLWRSYGIRTYGAEEDCMLLHHALQPESLKGLGFLGSIYTDEGAWKQIRSKHETIKKDD
jgi:uracil-DNA glycosylase